VAVTDNTWPESWLRLVTAIVVLWHAVPPGRCLGGEPVGPRPPNVIVILVDDLGWKDLACQGSEFYETPQIDRLAASGMRFTQGYSACPVCSPTRAAMVASVDDAVGRIVATLAELGIRDQTAIFFTSDNGGLATVTDNRPLRAGKGSAYEGGVRVPFIVSCPGVTAPGSESDVPVITPDIPATIFALTGVGPDPVQPLDGRDLSAVLAGGTLDRDAIYWHYPHYHPGGATPYSAIRSGSWRLVHFYEDDRDELYDLASDPSETTDLVAKQPERARALRAQLDAWLAEVGGQLPVPNPDHDPARDGTPKRKR
jgi:arylsulfatase A-like enzyme